MRVSASGGEPEVLVKTAPNEFADSPQMLDQQWLLFTLARDFEAGRWDRGEIVLQSLTTGERRIVIRGGGAARFVPTGLSSPSGGDRRKGHLVYAVGNTLRAVSFDLDRLEVSGTAVSILEQVDRAPANATNSGVAQYAVSDTGTLAFIAGQHGGGDGLRSLALVGMDGRVERLPFPPQSYIHPRVSPDGQRVAVGIEDGQNANVWVYQLAGGGAPRRLTFGGRNQFPIWSRDGRFIAYQSDREKDFAVFRQLADGSGAAERLTTPAFGEAHEPESWRPDGRALSLNLIKNGDQGVWEAPVDAHVALRPIAADAGAVEKHSTFSPDGRWIAYMVNPDRETGVYVEPYPPTGAKYQVPMTQTRTPTWSADGKRLFFHSTSTNQLWVVDVHAEQGLTFGTPVALPIEGTIHPIQQRNYDVMPDGRRLLVVVPAEEANTRKARESIQIGVVLDWFDDLKARVRPK